MQQAVLTFDSMHVFIDIAADPPPSDAINHYASLLACRSKVSMRYDYRQFMFGVLQAKLEKSGLSFSSENTSQKMFYQTEKISEIVNDSDSDGGSFSAKQIHPSAAAAAATARKRKLFSQYHTKAKRE